MPTLVLDGLRLWAAAHPGHRLLAAVDPRGVVAASLTAAQLLARAEAMAAGLRAAGVAPGDAVMLHFAVAFWGCLLARVAAVPFAPPPPWLPLLPRGAGVAAAGARRGAAALAALERAAARAGATTALSDGPLRAALLPLRLRAAAARLGAAATGGGSGGAAAPPPLTWMDAALVEASGQRRLRGDGAVGWREPPPGAGDVALLQCSSGSTGDPKPIVVTHGNLAHNCGLQRAALGVDAGCVQLSWCPLWAPDFAWALAASRQKAVAASAAAVPAAAAATAQTSSPAGAAAAAATAAAAPALDLSALRCALTGSDAVRPASLEAFAAAFAHAGFRPSAFVAAYGLAEHTLLAACGPPRTLALDRASLERHGVAAAAAAAPAAPAAAAAVRLLVGVGRSPPGVELLVVQPGAPHAPQPPDAVGEVWLRSPSVAAGYRGVAPGPSAATFGATPAGAGATEPGGGWLRTGDLGFLSSSLGGDLVLVGRLRDALKVRGRTLWPQDVEATAETAGGGALRPGCVAAFALQPPGPGDGGGEGDGDGGGDGRVCVAAEVRDGALKLRASSSASVAAVTLAAAVAAAVADAHGVRPAAVLLLPPRSLPKTTSGKLRRSEAARLVASGELQRCALNPQPPYASASPLAGLALLRPLPRPRRRALVAARVAARLAEGSAACAPLGRAPAPDEDLAAAGLGSAGAAALWGELAAAAAEASPPPPQPASPPLPPLPFTCASLARAVDELWAATDAQRGGAAALAGDSDGDGGWGDAPAEDIARPGSPSPQLPLPSRPPSAASPGAAPPPLLLLLLAAAHGASMARPPDGCPAPLPSLAMGPAYRAGWLPPWAGGGRHPVDMSHWRLLEWGRTVAPAALLLAAAHATGAAALGWALRRRPRGASASRLMPGAGARAAAWGGLHAAALHGVWCAPLLALALAAWAVSRLAPPGGRARPALAWLLCLLAVGCANALEPGSLAWGPRAREAAVALERALLAMLLPEGARPWGGLLAGSGFTANRSVRYMALRCLSYGLETAGEPGCGLALDEALAYLLNAPLYLCGPVQRFTAFRAAAAAPGPGAPSPEPGPRAAALRAAASALGAALAVELLCASPLYRPAAAFHAPWSHGDAAAPASCLRGGDWAAAALLWLWATHATSAAAFALPRALACAAHGAPPGSVPDDCPLPLWSASASVQRFWSSFHASLHALFVAHVYAPLRAAGWGDAHAVLAVTAFSTFIHGFHAQWLAWGAGCAAAALAERAARRLLRRLRLPPSSPAGRAANQACALAAFVGLALGPALPRRALGPLAAALAAGAALNVALGGA